MVSFVCEGASSGTSHPLLRRRMKKRWRWRWLRRLPQSPFVQFRKFESERKKRRGRNGRRIRVFILRRGQRKRCSLIKKIKKTNIMGRRNIILF